ncbi:MAG TPA: PIN domain nuclease [Micromonosporaceae bacterium]
MNLTRYLLDTSALVRVLRDGTVRDRWREQIVAGLVAICPVVELEFLHTARSKVEREELIELLATTFTWVSMPDQVFTRSSAVQASLTDRGWHRSAGVADLLVATCAQAHGLVLLHYDHDFEQVAKVTGQPASWIAEPGSID